MVLGRYIKYWDIEMQSGTTELLRKKKDTCRKNPCRFSRVLRSGNQQSSNCMVRVRPDMLGIYSNMRGFWLTHLIQAVLRGVSELGTEA